MKWTFIILRFAGARPILLSRFFLRSVTDLIAHGRLANPRRRKTGAIPNAMEAKSTE